MRANIFHTNGQAYDIPATQVVVYADNGEPLAVTYVEGDSIVHCDVGHPDWQSTVKRLGIKKAKWKPQ